MKIARILSAITALALVTTGLLAGTAAGGSSDTRLPEPDWQTGPSFVLEGPATRLAAPSAVAFDDSGRMYVANTGDNSITVYSTDNFGGNSKPERVLKGVNTLLDSPVAIAFDADQRMYVANRTSVTAYEPEWDPGDTAPLKVLSGPATGLVAPNNIAFDSIDRMYVSNGDGRIGALLGSVTLYRSDWPSGDTAPLAVLAGPRSAINFPTSLTFDESGFMYVTNSNGVSVYEPGWDAGDPSPVRVLTGPRSRLAEPRSVALDDQGYMYVLNVGRGLLGRTYVTVYGSNWSTSETSPEAFIVPDAWMVRRPQSMIFGSGGLLYMPGHYTSSVSAFQTQTLSLNPPSDVPWNSSSVTVSASSTAGRAPTISTMSPHVCSGFGSSPITITIKAMGTCSLEVIQEGDERLAPAPAITGSFEVTTAPQTITVSGPTSVSVSKQWTRVKASTTSGLPVVWASDTPDTCVHKRGFGQRVALKATGTCTLSAYQPGNSLWSSEGPESVSFDVTQ